MSSPPNNPLLASRNKKSDSIIPLVEQYFKHVSERFRSKIVSWASQDIPTRVAAVESTNISELMTNQEFRDSVIYAVINIRGVPVEGCVMMQYPMFAKLLEVSTGGSGNSDFSSPVRTLTTFEEQFASRTFEHLRLQMKQSWGFGRKSIDIHLSSPSLNQPNFGPKAKSMEVITATIDIGPLTAPYGLLSIALPSQLFERALGTTLKPEVEEEANPSFEQVMDVKVDLVAELQRIKMSVSELRSLHEGSFIPLLSQMDVCLRVNGKKRFMGIFGEAGGVRSVQIKKISLYDD